MLKNIFDTEVTNEVLERVNKLTPSSKAEWGKMDVGQMLAHLNVQYEMALEDIHSKPNAIVKFMLKSFVKSSVVGDKPYKKNSQTAPAFLMKEPKDFETEKGRLTSYMKKTQELGEAHFDGKESLSFGKLSSKEWNNLFHKHLDHHLTQFGA